jgi:hypothetical protein
LLLSAGLMLAPNRADAYSVLSHEAVVDLTWNDDIAPLLMLRFPATTPDQLKEAHAYAYGGCIIQDLGYYPFGSHYFSDLLHYVRTGDFVVNLLSDASDVNEYAFALGALAHYTSDSFGHPAVNLATAKEYPKLRRRFGKVVTYDENPTAHLQTEFGFDVVEVAHNRYASQQFHDFIGFQVSKPLLERAFRETYGFEINQVLTHEDLAISTYRSTVSTLLPKMTRVALLDFGKQIQKDDPSFDRRKFLYRIKRADFEKEWGRDYKKPGVGSRMLAFFLGILPKVGPLKALALHLPDPDTQKTFDAGMNDTVDHLKAYITELRVGGVSTEKFSLPDRDLDTGVPTAPGEYRLADLTYAKLLDEIVQHPHTPIPALLRSAVLNFYQAPGENYVAAKPKDWQKAQANLQRLQDARLDEIKVSDQPTKEQGLPGATP